MDLLQPAPLLTDPRRLLAGKDAAPGDVLRHPGRAPGGLPVAPRHRRLGTVQPLRGRVDVDPGLRREDDADTAAAFELDQPPQLREQRRQASVTSAGPDRLDELVTARGPQPVDHEEGEEDTALPAGQIGVDSPSRDLGDEPPTELDACRLQALAKVTARTPADNAASATEGGERWRS